MSEREPSSYTAEDLANPQIDPATLGKIAAVRPDLWSAILGHPNCYPELAEFIRQHQPQVADAAPVADAEPAVDTAAPAAETAAAAAPAVDFGQPAAAEPQAPAAPAQPDAGQPAQPQHPGQPQAQPEQPENSAGAQIADGAKQLADGVKDYFSGTVAPGFQAAINDANKQTGKNAWLNWLGFAVPGLALLGIIFLFLPAVSAPLVGSFNFFNLGSGLALLIAFLGVIGLSLYQLLNRAAADNETLTGITVGVTTLAGVFGTFSGFSPLGGGLGIGLGIGAGAILLIIVSLALIAGGVLVLLKKKLQAA